MKKNSLLVAFIGFLIPLSLSAQNEIDALRLGNTGTGSTARSIALGGTGGSFGGDFSSLSINPAGIGIYRSSNLMFTPSLQVNRANSSYLNTNTYDANTKMNLSNVGMVFTQPGTSGNWRTVSIGIGYNRLADFNRSYTYQGSNSESSLTDIMSQDAINNGIEDNMIPPFGFFGYEGFLLYDDLYSIPRNNILDKGGSLLQTKEFESSGGIDDWTFSIGGNYQDKLMLGLSFDLMSYNYKANSYFIEEDETGNPDNDFDYLQYHEYLSTTGFGFNMKLGAIYMVSDKIRVGAAIHTPSWSAFSDVSDYDLTSHTENLKRNTGQSDVNPTTVVQPEKASAFDYNLTTPWRAVASITGFLGTHGFITADYSFVDYRSMRYNFGSGFKAYEREINQAIKNTFTGGHNLNIGIEGRWEQFTGRLGYAYHSSPYIRSNDFLGQSMDISAGLGVRFNTMTLDLAYRRNITKKAEFAYPLLAQGVVTGIANIHQNNNLIALTMGFQF